MIKQYASYYVSYLLYNIKDISSIGEIVLFGSVARGQAGKNSDVDIFIDLIKPSKELEREINEVTENFYKSREALLFKVKGVENKISVIVGRLNDWKDLRKSIESSGFVLYGKYRFADITGRKYIVISWDKIGINRGAFLNKLYGFKVKDKKYKGLIEILGGVKVGKSSIMIPVEYREQVFDLLKDYEVHAKNFEVYSEE
ncbi:MAG: nucleotidyltransferase domain-containing protein [Nanoarchaeota archaeon]